MLAVDERGEALDGDQILVILALALGVDVVAVTVMTNLGFHRLMAHHGIRARTTGRRSRILEALREEGALPAGSSQVTSSGSEAMSRVTGSRRRCCCARRAGGRSARRRR